MYAKFYSKQNKYPKNTIINNSKNKFSNDAYKNFTDLANAQGYAVEQQQVTTVDGQILSLFRIPGPLGYNLHDPQCNPCTRPRSAPLSRDPKVNPASPSPADAQPGHQADSNKRPVLMVHGIEVDMMFWVGNQPEKAPAFILAQRNQDVWLVNNRGTRFSDKHISLNSHMNEFWQFDWEDMGTKDLPAVVDFILGKTGQDSLDQIGHSQGTTQLLAGAALMPDQFNQRINTANLLAPVASIKNNQLQIKGLKYLFNDINQKRYIKFWAKFLNYHVHFRQAMNKMTYQSCRIMAGRLCDIAIQLVMNENSREINHSERQHVMLSNMPAGSSLQSQLHFGQLQQHDSESFARYDWGTEINIEKYGSKSAPRYVLQNIKFPVAIQSGSQDVIASKTDVGWLKSQLKSVVFDKEYNLGHFSFATAKDMTYFSEDVIKFLFDYNNSKINV